MYERGGGGGGGGSDRNRRTLNAETAEGGRKKAILLAFLDVTVSCLAEPNVDCDGIRSTKSGQRRERLIKSRLGKKIVLVGEDLQLCQASIQRETEKERAAIKKVDPLSGMEGKRKRRNPQLPAPPPARFVLTNITSPKKRKLFPNFVLQSTFQKCPL